MKERAEIVETGIPLFFQAQLEIKAPAKKIFDFICDPRNHVRMDGSAMVKGVLKGPNRLVLGSKFGMRMKLGIPYVIKSEVIQWQENEVIAWQHLLHNVWKYELKEIDASTTLVIESWDGRNARFKWWVSDSGEWVPKAMAKTLVKLKEIVE